LQFENEFILSFGKQNAVANDVLYVDDMYAFHASRRTNREGETDSHRKVDEKKRRIIAEKKNSINITYNETE
jgi:hypothetical protein